MIYQTATFVRVEEWDGLYIGGRLVAEGSFDLFDELDGKTLHFRTRSFRESDEDYVMKHGGFPDDYETLFNYEVTND